MPEAIRKDRDKRLRYNFSNLIHTACLLENLKERFRVFVPSRRHVWQVGKRKPLRFEHLSLSVLGNTEVLL
jgi:hypothetical protein